MKNRIIALILVIATSLLTLVGCFGTVDAGRINYVADGYATFDSAAFDAGIKISLLRTAASPLTRLPELRRLLPKSTPR